MSETPPRVKRRKRSAEEARDEAMTAARELLLKGGPTAVTLAEVGRVVGMTHANVIHHFGSAAGLQTALMGRMVSDLGEALDEAVVLVRSDEAAPRRLIDIVFDAFDKGGAGYLAAWIVLSNNATHLEPVREAVQGLVNAIHEKFAGDGEMARPRITSAVLFMALCAFGDSVIGSPLRGMLDREDDAARKIVAALLPAFLIPEANL